MIRRLNLYFLQVLCALAMMVGVASNAGADPVRPSCHQFSDDAAPVDPEAGPVGDWLCQPPDYKSDVGTIRLLFNARDLAAASDATHLVSEVTRFEKLSMIVQRQDGTVQIHQFALDDIDTFANGPYFAAPLPDLANATSLIVAISEPWNSGVAAEAVLDRAQASGFESVGWSREVMLCIAVLCGLLLAPLIYNTAFYMVLRKEFILWHLAAIMGMLVYLLTSSGLYHYMARIDLETLLIIHPLSFVATVCLGSGFAIRYIEPEALTDRMRLTLRAVGWITLFVVGSACLPIGWLRPFAVELYYLGLLPLATVYVAAMIQAARCGSRAVWFLIVGWTLVILVGLERVGRGIGYYDSPNWVHQLFYVALAVEVIVTSLGVVDRFDIMRRERDRATARLQMLSGMVDRDALTGIFNRGALERRFAELRADGFTAMAVLDLDHFKQVNDRFGHSAGDRVLQEVAGALNSDDDMLPFRMGGEEFVLMIRGTDVQDRCERIRNAIPIRVANQVENVEIAITASMGLVEMPPGAATTMRRLYAHADRLLYEAKNSGRNRMIGERLQLFEAGKPVLSDRREPSQEKGRRATDHLKV